MHKKSMSLPFEVLIIAIIVLIFIVVASTMSGKIPKLLKSFTESSPFEEVCCCTAQPSASCALITRQDCQQKNGNIQSGKCN